MLNLVLFLSIFVALSHADDVIFRSKMGSAGAAQWTSTGSKAPSSKDNNDYCIIDSDGTKECTEMANGCSIYTKDAISTASYKGVKLEYYMTTHNKYPLEAQDTVSFYYSIDGSTTNWVLLKEYKGMDGFEYTKKPAIVATMDNLITVALPEECDDNTGGIRIKIANVAHEGNNDKVILDEVRIIGSAGTPQPTSVTPAPITPAPVTPAPITPAPITPAPITPAPITPAPVSSGQCDSSTPRVRRAYHLLSATEKQFYTNGIVALQNLGKFEDFAAAHEAEFSGQAHGTSAFLPWHRWFILELETQIRAIPGFECWTHAYWDIAAETELKTADTWWICSAEAGFGGYGNGGCIASPFNSITYGGQCIRRNPDTSRSFPGYEAIFGFFGDHTEYGDVNNECLNGFRQRLEQNGEYHPGMHCWIGGGGTDLCTMHSPSDPGFYLIHTFIDFAWEFWAHCHGKVGGANVGYCGDLEEVLSYERLSNGERAWSNYDRTNKIRPRNVLDNKYLNVVYDVGDFGDVDYNDEIEAECGRPVASMYDERLINPTTRRRLVGGNRGRPKPKRSAARNAVKNRKKAIFDRIMRDKNGAVKWSKAKRKELVKAECRDDEDRLNHHCDLPVSWYNCDDLPNGVNGDIDISLQGLLDRIDGSKCMELTRQEMYGWAKMTQTLRNLCDGGYDTFCDKDAFKSKMLTKAAANSIIFQRHNADEPEITPNQRKYVIFGSIILTVSILVTLCMVCAIRQCHNKQYMKIQSMDLEKEPPSDEEEEESEDEHDLL